MYWCYRELGAMWLIKVSVTVSSSTDTHQSLRLFCTCINVKAPQRKAASISDKELLFSHSFQERNQPSKFFCQCEYHLSTSWNILLWLQPSRTCNLEREKFWNFYLKKKKKTETVLKITFTFLMLELLDINENEWTVQQRCSDRSVDAEMLNCCNYCVSLSNRASVCFPSLPLWQL